MRRFVRSSRLFVALFRVATLAALAGSGLELARPLLSGQCGACAAARFEHVLGGLAAPLPWFGLGGGLTLLVLSFCVSERAVLVRTALSQAGGGIALGLLLLQAGLLRSYCPTCCVVNVAFLLVAISAAAGRATQLRATA